MVERGERKLRPLVGRAARLALPPEGFEVLPTASFSLHPPSATSVVARTAAHALRTIARSVRARRCCGVQAPSRRFRPAAVMPSRCMRPLYDSLSRRALYPSLRTYRILLILARKSDSRYVRCRCSFLKRRDKMRIWLTRCPIGVLMRPLLEHLGSQRDRI